MQHNIYYGTFRIIQNKGVFSPIGLFNGIYGTTGASFSVDGIPAIMGFHASAKSAFPTFFNFANAMVFHG
jgi:hypothetical protein